MPPNQDQNSEQSTQNAPQVISPGVAQSPAPTIPAAVPNVSDPASMPPVKADHSKKVIIALVALVIVGGLGTAALAYQHAKTAKQKFNNLALAIKNQEINGAKSYAAGNVVLNDIGNSISVTGSSASTDKLLQKSNAEIASFQKIIDKSCTDKASDITSAKIDEQSKGLKLSADQQQYLSDMKRVLAQLESTDYSNNGICSDGPAVVSFAKNIVNFLPGLNMLTSLNDTPSVSQLATLKTFTTMTIENESDLKKTMPNTDKFLTDLKTMLGDLYYEYSALQSGNSSGVLSYATKIEGLSTQFQTDTDNVTAEVNALDKKSNDAATAASKIEITAIDYQLAHKSSNANMQLDYALPAFRIADAVVSNYNDNHSKYPLGTSIDALTNLDDNLKGLKTKDLLKNLTYSSLGTDQSGYSLSAKLSDGTTLSEKTDPSSQNI